LEEFLGFRHVVRNVYGFELDIERVQRLLDRYESIWSAFEADVQGFTQWLLALSSQVEQTDA